MTQIWLPPHAWPLALLGTELETVWPHLPADAKVWAVITDGGEIVACGAFFPMLHHEGLWVQPSHRHSREVWAQIGELLAAHQPYLTGATTPVVERLLERAGALKLPGTMWRCGGEMAAHPSELKDG